MNKTEIRKLQRALNHFTEKYVDGFAPLLVDGNLGDSTSKRIRWVKYFLGYFGPVKNQNDTVDLKFRSRIWHPKNVRYSTPKRIWRGAQRRSAQRRKWKKNHRSGAKSTGVGRFDGKPCANWLIPYLEWARRNGWHGTLVSGWRDPVYSESLCFRICSRPSCAGLCAGRNSNHSGSVKPKGAMDVSDYINFASVISKCPLSPRIFNNLPNDRVHFSASGN